jgi:hypothetical protein
MSVPPREVNRRWDWDRVNMSLFRRGYRRIREHGVDGGIAIFHPYRIKKRWQSNFRAMGVDRDVGMWDEIRRRVQDGENLFKFVKLGPHVHGIVFGRPKAHECDDYVIRFNDDDLHVPKELELEDVIGLLMYLISHTGVLNHLRAYKRHRGRGLVVRKQMTHTVRAFGSLFRLDPRELLGDDEFNRLASEIATKLGMVWQNGELGYPASCKELATSDKTIEWIPIRRLHDYLSDEAWLTALSWSQSRFWFDVLEFMVKKGRPPDLGELHPPPDVLEFYERLDGGVYG